MTSPTPDPTLRFSNRVTDYSNARPSYPAPLIDLLRTEFGLGPACTVGDVGSGTGILTDLLLETGCRVIGVEPNEKMREAAEARLGTHEAFQSVPGTAENTRLPDDSVDVVTAAQAFHWFDVEKAAREFRRILRHGGGVALIWNLRQVDGSEFLRGYERFLEEWGRGYADVRASWAVTASVARLFDNNQTHESRFPNEQILDFEGLRSRFLSSSYAPSRDDVHLPEASTALKRLFDDHAEDGVVRMSYDAVVYYGRLLVPSTSGVG